MICSACGNSGSDNPAVPCGTTTCKAHVCDDPETECGIMCDVCDGMFCCDHAAESKYCECTMCDACSVATFTYTCSSCTVAYSLECRRCYNMRFASWKLQEEWPNSSECISCFTDNRPGTNWD